MAEPDAPARIDAKADLLRDAQDHGAGQRAPERAHAADDHGLEGEQQQQRAVRRRHRGAHALQRAGDGDEHEGDARGQRIDLLGFEAHQLGDLAVIGDRAEGAAQRRAREHPLHRARGRHRDRQDHQRQRPQRQRVAQWHRGGGQRADLDGARVGREQLQQQVLDHDRQAEGHDQRGQRVLAQRAVEHVALQQVAEAEGQRQHREHHQPWHRCAGHRDTGDHREGAQDDEVALRRVGQPHDAEHQRLAEREQRVEAAEQHALEQGFKHGAPRCQSRLARSARA
ncbi:hypothetical protein D3C72_1493570 [compost metagenome]